MKGPVMLLLDLIGQSAEVSLGSSIGCSPANATIMDVKELNKVVCMVKDKPQRLLYAPIKGVPRLMGFPDAAYKNNADGSSQRGQCILHLSAKKQGERHQGVID